MNLPQVGVLTQTRSDVAQRGAERDVVVVLGERVDRVAQGRREPPYVLPLIKVYVDGTQMTVPANIGIDPRVDGMQMAGLHTHDASGTIHVEGVPNAVLGQFFAIWGIAFTARRLGPNHARAGESVRMWVNGQPSHAFGALELAGGQHIVVSYRPTTAPAPH